MPTINFIGCGKLGKTIAKLIKQHNMGTIKGILNSTLESGRLAAQFVGEGTSYTQMKDLPLADIYFITTKDDLIEKMCNKLVAESKLNKGSIIIHCSGSLKSDVLQKAHEVGCYTFSVHPIKSFANPELAVTSFEGTYCAYEGDKEAFASISKLFNGIKAVLFEINKDQKVAYHAAGVIANNYLVSLHHTAVKCYKRAGVSEDIAYKITSMLMKDALQNLQGSDHSLALTGPLQRGDKSVITWHLSSISDSPTIKEVYVALGKATIPVTRHPQKLKDELLSVFNGMEAIESSFKISSKL